MGIISIVLNETDTVLTNYNQAVFNLVSAPMQSALVAAGVISLAFVGLNTIFNFRQITYSTYFIWIVRYACIVGFATVWGNFDLLRTAIVQTPLDYAYKTIASITVQQEQTYQCGWKGVFGWGLTPVNPKYCKQMVDTLVPLASDEASVNQIFDTFSERIFSVGGSLFDKVKARPSSWKYLISGMLVYIIGVMFAMTTVFILLMAKLGLAVMFALGPLAIGMLTFPQTRGYFESWLRMSVGFAVVPLIVASLMTVVVSVAGKMVQGSDSFFAGNLTFVVVATAALALMFQVPHIASSLSNTSLPQMGAGQMANAAMRMKQMIAAPMAAKTSIHNRVSAANNAAQTASAKGQGTMRSAYAGVKAMTQSSQYRDSKADRKARQSSALELARGKGSGTIGARAAARSGSNPAPSQNNAAAPPASQAFQQQQRNLNSNTANNRPA